MQPLDHLQVVMHRCPIHRLDHAALVPIRMEPLHDLQVTVRACNNYGGKLTIDESKGGGVGGKLTIDESKGGGVGGKG